MWSGIVLQLRRCERRCQRSWTGTLSACLKAASKHTCEDGVLWQLGYRWNTMQAHQGAKCQFSAASRAAHRASLPAGQRHCRCVWLPRRWASELHGSMPQHTHAYRCRRPLRSRDDGQSCRRVRRCWTLSRATAWRHSAARTKRCSHAARANSSALRSEPKAHEALQHVPLDDDSTRGLLARDCYSNHSVAASFEDVGAAHNISTVSARHLVGEQLSAQPFERGTHHQQAAL